MSAPTTRRPTPACPRCGSSDVAEILYGEIGYADAQVEMARRAGRIRFGGCTVWEGQPDLACEACDLEFRADGLPVQIPEGWQ